MPKLRRRDEPLARRDYPTLPPEDNGVYPSQSGHHIATLHFPDAIRSFKGRNTIRDFTYRPSLNCSGSGFGNRCWFCSAVRCLPV